MSASVSVRLCVLWVKTLFALILSGNPLQFISSFNVNSPTKAGKGLMRPNKKSKHKKKNKNKKRQPWWRLSASTRLRRSEILYNEVYRGTPGSTTNFNVLWGGFLYFWLMIQSLLIFNSATHSWKDSPPRATLPFVRQPSPLQSSCLYVCVFVWRKKANDS